MSRNVRRRFSAWLLLLVFVPVMVATSLHVHDNGGTDTAECELCTRHIHHGGHLNAYSDHVFDCPLCQFAGLPFIVPAVAAVVAAAVAVRTVYADDTCCLSLGVCDEKSTRAPPFLF